MSQMRDLPPIAGAIIWARQIERQLTMYMKRVEDVFGSLCRRSEITDREPGVSETYTRPVYDTWLHGINRRDMGVSGRLFEIVKLRGSGTGPGGEKGGYILAVNFDPQVITLLKEVRSLLWLGSRCHMRSGIWQRIRRGYTLMPSA
jgi:dynein heavy chain 1